MAKKMQHVKNLSAAALEFQRPCEPSRSQTSKKTGSKKSDPMPAHWVAGLFARFQAIYGHRWTSAIDGIEEQAVAAWGYALAGITGDQIGAGIDTLACEWPPSAPQFRLHCLYASGVPRPAQALELITSATYKTGTLRERYVHPAVLAAARQVDVFALRRQNATQCAQRIFMHCTSRYCRRVTTGHQSARLSLITSSRAGHRQMSRVSGLIPSGRL